MSIVYQLALIYLSLIINPSMKIILFHVIILFACMQMLQGYLSRQTQNLKSGEVVLFSAFGFQNINSRYKLHEDIESGDQLALNVRDLRIQTKQHRETLQNVSWQVIYDESLGEIVLDLNSSPSQTRPEMKIRVSYIILKREYFLSGVSIQPLTMTSETSTIYVRNGVNRILTGQKQVSKFGTRQQINVEIMPLIRGFKLRQTYLLDDIPSIKFLGSLENSSHFNLQVDLREVEAFYLTILLVDIKKFVRLGLEMKVTYQYFPREAQGKLVQQELLNQIWIQKCSKTEKDNLGDGCWALRTLNIINIDEINLNQMSESKSSYEQEGNKKRQLACYWQSCPCTDPYATQCWKDWVGCTKCYVGSCMNGYYAKWASTTCTICPPITNCLYCQLQWGKSTPTCKTCISGFLAVNGACVTCPTGCTTCTTITVSFTQKISCTACVATQTLQTSNSVSFCGCLSNQFLTGATCTDCISICTKCTSLATCTGCINGRYLSSPNCLQCMPVCKTCSTGATCDTCLSNLFTPVGSVCTCNSPNFFDIYTKSCLKCSSLQSNCATCGYATPYNPSAPPAVVCVTPNPGYYVAANGSTAACIDYCTNCTLNPLQCDIPKTDFIFNGASCVCAVGLFFYNGTCLACTSIIAGCTNCVTNPIPTPTQCSACNPTGYFNSTNYPVSACPACASLCLNCYSATDCTLCINNLVPDSGICTCNATLSLYYDSPSKTCLACSLVIFNCQTCATNGSTTVTCSSCGVGLYVSPNGLLCSPCPFTCSDCLNSSYCTTCQSGYDMINDTCICSANCTNCMSNSTDNLCSSCTFGPFACNGCLAGYLLNTNGTCSPCNSTFIACADCTNSTCVACASPFILMPSGCICNNTASLYLALDNSTCLPCSSAILNCLSCSTNGSATICTQSADGYLLTNNSQTCTPCAGNCLTCAVSITSCNTCLPTFKMVSNNTCGCDNTTDYFYDPSTQGCSLCSTLIPNCLACATVGNTTQCTLPSPQYYWNATTGTCSLCPSACFNCSSSLTCTSCPATFVLSQTVPGWMVVGQCVCDNSTATAPYYDPITKTCQSCTFFYPSCSICNTNGTGAICLSCSDSMYLANGTCFNCPSTCGNCTSATVCTSCPGNLTLSGGACICDSTCTQCQGLSTGCVSCSILAGAITACFACESNTYLVSPSCVSCPSTCATCTDSNTCLTCQPSYIFTSGQCACATTLGMFPNSAGVCVPCSQIYYGCADCGLFFGVTACVASSPGYYVSAGQTYACSATCLQCSDAPSNCTNCASGQSLVNNTCVCTDAACVACNATSPNCMLCVYTIYGNFSKCDACQPGFYINGVNCSPCPTDCLTCGSNGVCLTCPNTFQVINGSCICNHALASWESGGVCVACTVLIPNCLICVQNTSVPLNVSCPNCTTGYYLLNESCTVSVCGDGIITSGEVCDDANTANNDGCNSFCFIQANFLCTGTPSVCTINLNYHIYFNSITVSPTLCNHISVSFTMDPVYSSYDAANFGLMLNFVGSSSFQYRSWAYSNGVVTYNFDYTETIDNLTVIFYFSPSSLGVSQTTTVPIITVTVLLLSSNNLALVYYPPEDCESKAVMRGLTKIVEYVSYGTLALSAVPCKIVGLELFGVLQLAYLSAGSMDSVNTMMTPLMDMKGVNGFAVNMGKQSKKSRLLQGSLTPARVGSIGYESNFLRNCNIMLIIVTSVIAVAFFLYVCTYCCKSCAPSLHIFSKRMFKEVLLTIILFNCFNFAYSAGIHFNYAATDDPLYKIGTFAAVLAIVLPLIMAIGLVCAEESGFGEFKEKFKKGMVERLYFVVTILYRTGIGLYMSTQNEDSLSTLMVMALSIGFLLYNLVNLPYAKAYHNYRANVCHFAQCICLFVAMYYRSMTSSTDKTVIASQYTPAYIEIAAIMLSLIVSLIVLVYQIYLFVKECCVAQPQNNDNKNLIVVTHENEKVYMQGKSNPNNFSIDFVEAEADINNDE